MPILVNGVRLEDHVIETTLRELQVQRSDPAEKITKEMARQSAIERELIRQEALARFPTIPTSKANDALREFKQQFKDENQYQAELQKSGVSEEDLLSDLRTRIKIDLLLDEVCRDLEKVDEDTARDYFDANPESFMEPERVRASHIVKHASENIIERHEAVAELERVKTMIDQGIPFERLAGQYSDCPDRAGDLGYFSRGQMVPEFEAVVFNMEVGAISDVFTTPFGAHIAKLTDHIPAKTRNFDDVKSDVINHLYTRMENEQIDKFVAQLMEKSVVEDLEEVITT